MRKAPHRKATADTSESASYTMVPMVCTMLSRSDGSMQMMCAPQKNGESWMSQAAPKPSASLTIELVLSGDADDVMSHFMISMMLR